MVKNTLRNSLAVSVVAAFVLSYIRGGSISDPGVFLGFAAVGFSVSLLLSWALSHVRDVLFAEDGSQVRSGILGQALSAIRNACN